MKKRCVIILFLSFLIYNAAAQDKIKDRADLKELLNAREQKFGSYAESLEKKSGFFGNKTKRDVAHTNEVLIEIVKTDNKIIGLLYRVVDFKNYEKINLNYDLHDRSDQMENLLNATDTLSKQVKSLTSINKDLTRKSQKLQWLCSLLILLMVITTLKFLRQK